MKAVVTGATGFVGKNIVNELLLHDVEVLAVVRNMVTENNGVDETGG